MSVDQPHARQPAIDRRWRILLVSTNRCTSPEPVFPLGLAHLSAALQNSGHQVEWLDLLIHGDRFGEKVVEFKPDLVGISLRNIDDVIIRKQETFIDGLADLVQSVHQKLGSPVVLGGSGFSILPKDLLELSGADFGIIGEGEITFPALIRALETRGKIPAQVLVNKNGLTTNVRSEYAEKDQIAFADLRPQVAGEYLRRGGILNVQTQRGCAHRCCYCTYPIIEGTRHRRRPVEAVVAEFEQIEKLGAQYAFVVDSVFNSSAAHVHEVCEALVRRKLSIRWGCFLRPQGLAAETMQLMARAGLTHVEFGSDSFCDEVLESYQKDLTFDDILHSTELASSQEIHFCHFIIAGGPGETMATLEVGFRNSQRLGEAVILAVPGMRIYPGTRLFQRALSEKRLEADAHLLYPEYYFAPGLTLDQVLETLRRFASACPNWVVGDFDPGYEKLISRLRQRGITGPLWSYFATAQRLWPRQGMRAV